MNYRIDSDATQWKLVKESIAKEGKRKGEINEQVLGYYSTLEAVKKASIEKILKIDGLNDLLQAKEDIMLLLELHNEL